MKWHNISLKIHFLWSWDAHMLIHNIFMPIIWYKDDSERIFSMNEWLSSWENMLINLIMLQIIGMRTFHFLFQSENYLQVEHLLICHFTVKILKKIGLNSLLIQKKIFIKQLKLQDKNVFMENSHLIFQMQHMSWVKCISYFQNIDLD